jgi:hypothetical protein
MGHAGDLADGTGAVEILEFGKAIHYPAMVCLQTMRAGMHPAPVSGEVILRVLAFAIS